MSMKQIRQKYNVPAKRGMQVELEHGLKGIIVGSHGLYLRIRVFDSVGINTFHPTWNVKYPNSVVK